LDFSTAREFPMFPPRPRPVRPGRRAAAALALALGLLAVLALGPPAQAGGGRGVRLRVMAYDVQAGAGADHVFDLERQARAIEAEHPDVRGLEEVDVDWAARSDYVDEASWPARRLHMRVFYRARRGRLERVPILRGIQ
jgi:hypothetical protein